MSSDDTNSDIGAIQGVEKTLLKATELLEKHFGYTNRKILCSGSFGWVIRLNYPQRKNGMAVKVPHLKDTREGEQKIWIRLRTRKYSSTPEVHCVPDRTPSHAPAADAITATVPVGWTWDG
ncbi:hypothetical protein AVEN_213424-1, partial [Araneus ventricosus]